MAESSTNLETLLGRVVVEQGLATDEEVKDCLAKFKSLRKADKSRRRSELPNFFVDDGLITRRQLERLKPKLDEQHVTQQIPDFHILRKLGAGAMATVYLAKQLSLDRMVAIKVLPKKYNNNKEFVERFYAEGRAAAKLNHQNIVQAYLVGKAGEFHYFVMEYVDGKTVYDDIAEGKAYKEETALDIVTQIARALVHAHQKGFIHRDLKPKNIMITREGVAKLADMGLARAVSDRDAAEAEQGKAYGTPYYISPEQIRGDMDIDFRCDIYGLGATMYHMVTGQVPFEAPNPSAVMHKHLKAKLVPPDHINPNLSAGISEIVEVTMAKDRDERYLKTQDLLDDLELVMRGESPVHARRRFDLSSLSMLESNTDAIDPVAVASERDGKKREADDMSDLMEQPLFWAAVGGWVLVIILLVTVFVINASS